MKKFSTLLLCIALSLTAVACSPARKTDKPSVYTITASYADSRVEGTLEYALTNTTDTAITSQSFLLYGKAYKEKAAHPAVINDKAYFAGKSYGDMTVSNVTVSGNATEPVVSGEDGEIVTVSFSELFPGEIVRIKMDFCVDLAKINHRLGVCAHSVNLGGWFPTAVPTVDGKALTYPYYAIGDPFCTDTADFSVSLTVPENYTVVATAEGQRTGNTYTYSASKVRDFAAVLSSEFQTVSQKVGDTTVTYAYYQDREPNASLKIATQALSFFGEKIGAYPYSSFSVAQTGFLHGGMEYPGLVMISDATGELYGETIVHETAHQWWYAAVGNDQVANAWQDEGLTDFMTTLFYDAHAEYGQDRTTRIMHTLAMYLSYVDVYSDLNGKVDSSMDRPLDKFSSEQEYTYMTYLKGELMFDTLRTEIGEEKFDKALKQYFKTYLYKRATPADLIACFNRASGRDVTNFFRSWLNGNVVIA